ncbi:hypothetical protein WA026_015787 [Henosepilachna vigintioctopunctata]|uniref:Uncharacterized protein n=1 Tax=Henosepilachna vigintioctopunctata TaxID=420089 RepID=A0AAW1V2G6_9CUCU
MHSLIYLADDAKYLNAPISQFTAFLFESLLGQIKKLLRNGMPLKKEKPMLQYPCNSEMLQMWKITEPVNRRGQDRRMEYELSFIELKMLLLHIESDSGEAKKYAMPLLHMI